MSNPPDNPRIYHITHVDNLSGIIQAGALWSDAKRIENGLDSTVVGMSKIKKRRLEELEVHCHPGTMVGQYVPFYFCPRSIMLYILHRGNHEEIRYAGSQRPILHLTARLADVVEWAADKNVKWAFSTSNAGAYLADFFNSLDDLSEIDWRAVGATRWSGCKEAKQAEFLLYESLPWELVRRVGVHDKAIEGQVLQIVADAAHKPVVKVMPSWYY